MHPFNIFSYTACCLYLIETGIRKSGETKGIICSKGPELAVVKTKDTVHTLDELPGIPKCIFYPSVSLTGYMYGYAIQLPALLLLLTC